MRHVTCRMSALGRAPGEVCPAEGGGAGSVGRVGDGARPARQCGGCGAPCGAIRNFRAAAGGAVLELVVGDTDVAACDPGTGSRDPVPPPIGTEATVAVTAVNQELVDPTYPRRSPLVVEQLADPCA